MHLTEQNNKQQVVNVFWSHGLFFFWSVGTHFTPTILHACMSKIHIPYTYASCIYVYVFVDFALTKFIFVICVFAVNKAIRS